MGEGKKKQIERMEIKMQEKQILLQLANILMKNQLLTPDEEARLAEKIRNEVN